MVIHHPLWIDGCAIVRLGALAAVRTQRRSRALWQTLLPTFLPTPLGALGLAMILNQRGITPDAVANSFLILFSGLILCSLLFGHHAESRLTENFRSHATGSDR